MRSLYGLPHIRRDSSHNVPVTEYVEILKAELRAENYLHRGVNPSMEMPPEKANYRSRKSDDSWIPRLVRFGPKGRTPTLDDYDAWAWSGNL